jgi:hypothetical protein
VNVRVAIALGAGAAVALGLAVAAIVGSGDSGPASARGTIPQLPLGEMRKLPPAPDRYRPRIAVDLDRFDVHARRLVLDAASGNRAGIAGRDRESRVDPRQLRARRCASAGSTMS